MIDFFHGTSTKVLESIKREGIIPARSKGGVAWAQENLGGVAFHDQVLCGDCRESVYLTTNPWLARDFAEKHVTEVQGGEPVVLRVRFPAREEPRVKRDDMWANAGSERWGTGFKYRGVVKPRWIKEELR